MLPMHAHTQIHIDTGDKSTKARNDLLLLYLQSHIIKILISNNFPVVSRKFDAIEARANVLLK